MQPTTDSKPDLVLLVHGTYAARQENEGTSWWQIGSQAYEGLRQRLPNGAQLTKPDEVFHWSGENSERARIKAGIDLLARLKALEAQGRGYHLIGHSHGGSVIWHTLRLATLGRIQLDRLRSWTTLGTPFLRHQTHRSTRIANIFRVALGIILFQPACTTAVRFYDLVFRPEKSLWTHSTELPKRYSLYETPVLRLLELMHIPMEQTGSQIRVGGFSSGSGSGISSVEFLFTTPIGWVLMVLAIVVIYVYLNLTVFFLRPVLESWQMWAERRLENRACKLYEKRWLGLWSPDDEAINGLRATLDLSVSFVSRMAPKDRVLFSDYVTLIWQPYYWVLTPVFNFMLRPFLDGLVRSYVVKAAQGNNRPGADVVEVTPVPWHVNDSHQPICLPNWLNTQLVEAANDCAREIIPKLRSVLASPSFVSGMESCKGTLGRELVHTSYFDHSEMLDLMAMHVVWFCRSELSLESCCVSARKAELVGWLAEAKSRVGATDLYHLQTSPAAVSTIDSTSTCRIKPRRRHIDRAA
jgi:hypothetical protein